MVILDTDHLTLLERRTPLIAQVILNNLAQIPEWEICTTIVNFEEQMRGWLSFAAKSRTIKQEITAYSRLRNFLENYRGIRILDFDERAAKEFQNLKNLKLRVGTMDLKIAGIALANNGLLLTRNFKDFEQIPNLKIEDWTFEQAVENQ